VAIAGVLADVCPQLIDQRTLLDRAELAANVANERDGPSGVVFGDEGGDGIKIGLDEGTC